MVSLRIVGVFQHNIKAELGASSAIVSKSPVIEGRCNDTMNLKGLIKVFVGSLAGRLSAVPRDLV